MTSKARLIAFYLPQYHPIPENDQWWGKGFTEWTNVAKAKPLFVGHQQPRTPADLGFYDLRVPETRAAQASLAQEYGIEGFCYWHYWFGNHRRLLERPFDEVLRTMNPDFPFCLAWANHDWSGVWHGCPDKILMKQEYPGIHDHRAHFETILPAFKDRRYITVDGKPLFLIYHPYHLPDCKAFAAYWQELATEAGLKGIFFVGIGAEDFAPSSFGLDGATTNPPMNVLNRTSEKAQPRTLLAKLLGKKAPAPKVFDYAEFVANAFPNQIYDATRFPCVIPNWDNTPRSGYNGVVLSGATPDLYEKHLDDAIRIVSSRDPETKIVFIKSWNEWAEGNYLEPDLSWGNAYLEATRNAAFRRGEL